jgi:hypothetical protein
LHFQIENLTKNLAIKHPLLRKICEIFWYIYYFFLYYGYIQFPERLFLQFWPKSHFFSSFPSIFLVNGLLPHYWRVLKGEVISRYFQSAVMQSFNYIHNVQKIAIKHPLLRKICEIFWYIYYFFLYYRYIQFPERCYYFDKYCLKLFEFDRRWILYESSIFFYLT